MPAARAREVGLVNEVFADQRALVAGVLAIAGEIAPRVAARDLGLEGDDQLRARPLGRRRLNYIATWQSGMFQAGDMMEAFAARAEKRAPRFADLLPAPRKL